MTYSSRLGLGITADLEDLRLQPAAELAILRIAQEGLANAIRHSRANVITLRLRRKASLVELVIADDGSGFEPGGTGGLGLRLMRERAEEIGGSLTIESSSGHGSVVTATIPGVME
jgi:signal transduction histidine kinase